MRPGDHQDREQHPHFERRPRDPVGEEHLRVEYFLPVQRMAEPHADHVRDDHRGNAQPQHQLQRLDRFPAELPALVQRPDAEPGVNEAGRIEDQRDGEGMPEQRVPIDAAGQRLHRDVAERVVEEMADQIGKQDRAGGQADLPQADAAQAGGDLFTGQGGHAVRLSWVRRQYCLIRVVNTARCPAWPGPGVEVFSCAER